MLTRFYVYRFLIFFYLWLPVSVIYMREMRGLTLAQITVMGAVGWVVSAAAEVPTGAVADVWGRRVSLAIGAFLYGLAFVGNAFGSVLWVLMVFAILQNTAFTFITGADMAWLFDTLKQAGREEEFVKHQGRAMSVMYAAQGIAAVLGSWLGLLGLQLPFLVAGLLTMAAGGVALTLKEPPVARVATAKRNPLWATFAETVRVTRDNPEVRHAIFYSAATYVAPFLLFYVLFQPYAQSIGIPHAWIGAGLVVLRVVSLTGAHWAHAVRQRIGEKYLLWLTPAAIVAAIVGMAVTPTYLSLALIAVVLFLNAIHRPVVSATLNRHVTSEIRATVLSTANLLSVLLVAVVQPVMGAVADRWGIPAMLLALAAAGGLAAYGVLLLWRPGLSQKSSHHLAGTH